MNAERPIAGVRGAWRMSAVRTIGSAYVAWLTIVLMAAWFAENLAPVRAVGAGQGGPILGSLTRWDGNFYLSVARTGYHAVPLVDSYRDYAFFPLYPLLVRLLSLPGPGAEPLAAVLLSNVCFVGALWLLYLLGRPHLGEREAARGAALLAVFPFATVFAMAYTESLFLLLSVAAFVAAERGNRPAMAVALGLAALTRVQGVLLVIPLIVLLLRQDGWRPRASQLWLAGAPIAFLGFMAYVWVLTGDPGGYFTAQSAWHVGPAPGAPDLGGIGSVPPQAVLLLVAVAAYVFLFVYVRPDGLAPQYVALPLVYLAAIILPGALQSAPRYLTAAFPFAWILARRRNRLFRQAWPLVSTALLAMFSLLVFSGWLVP